MELNYTFLNYSKHLEILHACILAPHGFPDCCRCQEMNENMEEKQTPLRNLQSYYGRR